MVARIIKYSINTKEEHVMFRKKLMALLAVFILCMATACSKTESKENDVQEASEAETAQNEGSEGTTAAEATVSDELADNKDALIASVVSKFEQMDYVDEETGLSITYNLYLPESYEESREYPLVVFIADSSCTGNDAEKSLSQGRGALVWASEQWQSVYETIVAVPSYPVTILDDHGSYTTTEYVELTKRFIDFMSETYAVDTGRIYGTGQSMGCMTTLILASEYPDLFSACMFVDGQWDVSTLSGLQDQCFVYFAAEDDENAYSGMKEVMSMFDEDSVSYLYEQWDGGWTTEELSEAAQSLFSADENQYFISWKSGTIDASSSNMRGSAAYHMASFDYAYNCIAVMEWMISQ